MCKRVVIGAIAVCLSAATANAQPLLVIEHDWTLQFGNSRWGLLQSNMAPGDWRKTTVYLGGALFTVRARARTVVGFVIATVGALAAVRWMTRDTKSPA